MNKEQKIWFLVLVIGGVIYMTMMSMALYGIRFKYGLHIAISAGLMAYMGMIMFALTQYVSTREIVSILMEKIKDFVGSN